MKIRANSKFKEKLSANSKLYSGVEYSKLVRGKAVKLTDKAAAKLISYGLAEEVKAKPKKANKEKK